MAADRTTQANLLRRIYQPRMQTQFNLRSMLLQRMQRDSEKWQTSEGLEFSYPLHTGATGGIGWSTAGQLPASGHQRVGRHTYNFKRQYGVIEITGPHMEGAKTKKAAERDPLDFETKNIVKQMRHHLNFLLFGDGSGILATPASASSSTVLVVDDVRGILDNYRIDVIKSADGTTGGGVIAADVTVNFDTKTLTLTNGTMNDFNDVNTNPSDYRVYVHNTRNDVINGLDAFCATGNPAVGNLGGIDRTAAGNEFWQGNIFANSGKAREITFSMIEEACARIEKRSDGYANLAICGYEVFAQLVAGLQSQRRYTGEMQTLHGWAKALVFEDHLPIVRDKHCDPSKMYIGDMSTITLVQNDEGSWMDKDGAILHRIEGYESYTAAWRRYIQPVCHAPNAWCRIDDLDTTRPD